MALFRRGFHDVSKDLFLHILYQAKYLMSERPQAPWQYMYRTERRDAQKELPKIWVPSDGTQW